MASTSEPLPVDDAPVDTVFEELLKGELMASVHNRHERGDGPWRVRYVCCRFEDGRERFETWDEADAARTAYMERVDEAEAAGYYQHDRVAIIDRQGRKVSGPGIAAVLVLYGLWHGQSWMFSSHVLREPTDA